MSLRSNIIQISLLILLSFKVESVSSGHVLSLLRKQVQGTKWEIYHIKYTIRQSLSSVYKRDSQFFEDYQRTHIENLFESSEGSMSLSMSMSMSMRLVSDYPSFPPRTIDDKTPAPSSFDTVDLFGNVPTLVPESLHDNNNQQMIDDSDSKDTVQMTSSPSFDTLPNEIGGDIERKRGGDENHSKLIAGGTTLIVLFGLSLIALLGMIAIRRRSNGTGANILGANDSTSSVALSSLNGSNV